MNEDTDKILEKLARKRVKKISNFYTHLFIYSIGVIIYVSKSYFGAPLNFWPIRYINEFFMWCWTFVIVVQGLQLFFNEIVLGNNWEKKEIEKIVEKGKTKNQKWE